MSTCLRVFYLCGNTAQTPGTTDGLLTQKVSREVDGEDDANREDTNYHQQANYVSLEGQIMDSILATLLSDLFIPEGQFKSVTWWR